MSITFMIAGERVVEARAAGADDTWDDATRDPEVNLSNANAATMLRLAGLPCAPSGEAVGETLDFAIRRLIRVSNQADARAPGIRPRHDSGGVSGPRVIEFGLTDEGIRDRAARLLQLFRAARQQGRSVVWG